MVLLYFRWCYSTVSTILDVRIMVVSIIVTVVTKNFGIGRGWGV